MPPPPPPVEIEIAIIADEQPTTATDESEDLAIIALGEEQGVIEDTDHPNTNEEANDEPGIAAIIEPGIAAIIVEEEEPLPGTKEEVEL